MTSVERPIDRRTSGERRDVLAVVRDGACARALLRGACVPLEAAQALAEASRTTSPELWTELDEAYRGVDSYIEHLVKEAELHVRCGPACATCCTEAPPTLALEGLRMVRALRERADGGRRLARAIDHARRFQRMLLEHAGPDRAGAADITSEVYRRTQLAWRALGNTCVVLGDDQNCAGYDARPLACRVHISIEDPAHCAPRHPRFLDAERPPVWGSHEEAEVERRLLAIGRALGLAATPNLPWALAALHDHPLARAE